VPNQDRYELEDQRSNERRGVAFLVGPRAFINALEALGKLKPANTKKLLRAIDYWLSGCNNTDCHHGWDKSEHDGKYTRCHVFKVRDATKFLRFYGYKFHPKSTDAGFEACVIIHHATKSAYKTDVAILAGLVEIAELPEVQAVVKTAFGGGTGK